MKVSELLTALAKLPPDKEIFGSIGASGGGIVHVQSHAIRGVASAGQFGYELLLDGHLGSRLQPTKTWVDEFAWEITSLPAPPPPAPTLAEVSCKWCGSLTCTKAEEQHRWR